MKTGKTLRNFLLVLAALALVVFLTVSFGLFCRAHTCGRAASRTAGSITRSTTAPSGLDYVGEV